MTLLTIVTQSVLILASLAGLIVLATVAADRSLR